MKKLILLTSSIVVVLALIVGGILGIRANETEWTESNIDELVAQMQQTYAEQVRMPLPDEKAELLAHLNTLVAVADAYFPSHPDCAFLLEGTGADGSVYLSDCGSRLPLTAEQKTAVEGLSQAFSDISKNFDVIRWETNRISFQSEDGRYLLVYCEADTPPTYFLKGKDIPFFCHKLRDHWYEVIGND